MQKNLVIVESPAKAKTIEKFLGKDYKVMSSFGHIRDLKKKDFSIDTTTFAPTYEIPTDKKKVVEDLRKAASQAEMVWLASDEDRERPSAGTCTRYLGSPPTTRSASSFTRSPKRPSPMPSRLRARLTPTSSMPSRPAACSTASWASSSPPSCGRR